MYERFFMSATSRTRVAQSASGLCDTPCVDEEKVRRLRGELNGIGGGLGAVAETFRVLGDSTRVSLVWALAQGEMCVCDLAALLGASQSRVSHSLRALKELRLVRYRKEGRIAYYTLDDGHVSELLDIALRHVQEPGS